MKRSFFIIFLLHIGYLFGSENIKETNNVENINRDECYSAMTLKKAEYNDFAISSIKEEIVFLGVNRKPTFGDSSDRAVLLVLNSSGDICSIKEREKVGIIYDLRCSATSQKSNARNFVNVYAGKYYFTNDLEKAALIITCEADAVGESIELKVYQNAKNDLDNLCIGEYQIVKQGKANLSIASWELGEFKVDTNILVRQKAKWIGRDAFLEEIGGDEYSFVRGREKIEFFTDKTSYTCFVKEKDMLVWNGKRWELLLDPSVNVTSKIVLEVKKIEDRNISFLLWNEYGNAYVSLMLVKHRDLDVKIYPKDNCRFVGVKTWSSFVLELDSENTIVKPNDWLLQTREGWKVLKSVQQIEDYVQGKLVGPLMIIRGLERKDSQNVLKAYLFSTNRSEMKEIELAEESAGNKSAYNSIHNKYYSSRSALKQAASSEVGR